jgi:hypothetical protein
MYESLNSTRGKFLANADSTGRTPISRLNFLKITLEGVMGEKGLLHGTFQIGAHFNPDRPVCALGAFAKKMPDNVVMTDDAAEIQAKNDSWPKATPAQRRSYMIGWLKKQIAIERLRKTLFRSADA